jgi:AcrR family transcriptional regulator
MVRIVKKSAERRSEIVQAARRLFLTKEYEKASMQDIMDSLRIAKGTIYHYFKSKEALLEAVIEDIVEESIGKMQTIIKESQGNALEKIQMLVKAGNMAADNNAILEHLHRRGNDAMHIRLLAATLVKQAPLYGKLIQQGCNEGIFQTDTPLECAEFILSAFQFLTDMGIYPWTQEDLLRRVQAFPKIIEQLLKAPPGSFQFLIHQMQ